MRKALLAVALLALATVARGQAIQDAFTITGSNILIGVAQTNYRHLHLLPTDFSPTPCTGTNPYCGVPTYWPEPCPPGINCGGQNGQIQLISQPTVSGLAVPEYLGFPNGGYLLQDCTLVYGPIAFNQRPDGTTADGSKVGDTWSFQGAATCTGYGAGVTFTVTTNWVTGSIKVYCGRGGCATNYVYYLTGGSGVADYTPQN